MASNSTNPKIEKSQPQPQPQDVITTRTAYEDTSDSRTLCITHTLTYKLRRHLGGFFYGVAFPDQGSNNDYRIVSGSGSFIPIHRMRLYIGSKTKRTFKMVVNNVFDHHFEHMLSYG